MAKLITMAIRDRGNTPRGMKRAFNAASKAAWHDTAVEFHRNYRDKRFTPAHAAEAGYMSRKGEQIPRGTKAFRQSYTGRKLRKFGHTNPLEYSGETRRKVRSASISSTSKGGKAAYAGASKFNFRHSRSKIRMSEEFQRITAREAESLGQFYDQRLDYHLAQQDASPT
jgi:hypothetical protein